MMAVPLLLAAAVVAVLAVSVVLSSKQRSYSIHLLEHRLSSLYMTDSFVGRILFTNA